MDIRSNLIELFKYAYRLGPVNGIANLLKVYTGNMDNIRIKGFKHPFKLRKSSSDVAVFNQVFIEKEYNFDAGFHPRFIIDGGGVRGTGRFILRQCVP